MKNESCDKHAKSVRSDVTLGLVAFPVVFHQFAWFFIILVNFKQLFGTDFEISDSEPKIQQKSTIHETNEYSIVFDGWFTLNCTLGIPGSPENNVVRSENLFPQR